MKSDPIAAILDKHNLRNTQTRRLVLQALSAGKKSFSPTDVREWINSRDSAINTVTVYRILERLMQLHIVHRHPCNGHFSLCSLPDTPGHHGFLHCTDCGTIEEFCDAKLCQVENAIAKKSGYRPSGHLSEIHGTCAECS